VDTWSSPTTVYAGGLAQLPTAVGGRRIVLVADQRLARQIDAVRARAEVAALHAVDAGTAAGRGEKALVALLSAHPDAVPVALGGGSVMDLVRWAVLLHRDPPAAAQISPTSGVVVVGSRLTNPTVCLPTTVGTASEVSPVAVRHRPDGIAMLVSPALRPAAAVYDPELTSSLPRRLLAAGLVEPWARVCVPAVTAPALRLQDGLARGLLDSVDALGEEIAAGPVDASWRTAAAQASAQTHLGLLALGRPPAGHQLWPLAVELMRVTGQSKAEALAALLPAWLDSLAAGELSPVWGSAARTRTLLGHPPERAAARVRRWLTRLGLPVLAPRFDPTAVTARVITTWQRDGLFLPGVEAAEISAVLARCAGESQA
jgi:NADP-dependent alcohol dehydrogenase